MNGQERENHLEGASEALLEALEDVPQELWRPALSRAVASVFRSMRDAKDMLAEEEARKRLE